MSYLVGDHGNRYSHNVSHTKTTGYIVVGVVLLYVVS